MRSSIYCGVLERTITPRRDPDVVLFNFISHNSFLRLPLSLLQQCLREV